jgi:hypothetical protein
MTDPVHPDQPERVKNRAENLNVNPISQVSLHEPDQPYTPSTDDVMRQQAARAVGAAITNASNHPLPSAVLGRDMSKLINAVAESLLPFIASVRREAQEEASHEIARLTGTATIAAAIRRTEKAGEDDDK